MPIYTYRCEDCRLEFDRFKPVSKRRMHKCPECGEMVGKVLSVPSTAVDSTIRDLRGQPIWFPKDGRPYFDRALRRTFNSKQEKKQYMDDKKLVMDGSDNPKHWPIESGDLRSREYRKQHRLED